VLFVWPLLAQVLRQAVGEDTWEQLKTPPQLLTQHAAASPACDCPTRPNSVSTSVTTPIPLRIPIRIVDVSSVDGFQGGKNGKRADEQPRR
jgi:hypothetical protein